MIDIILVGGGGHCKSVIDAILSTNTYNIVGITDPCACGKVSGYEILGNDDQLKAIYDRGVEHAFVTVGSVGNPQIRQLLMETLKAIGYKLPVIIGASAYVSPSANIGEGSFIGQGAVVNALARIDENCIINTGAIVEHDCYLQAYVHIAPGAVLSGCVSIGKNSHIGTNATVIQNISVGQNVLIGAGSVVVKDIMDSTVAYGNPCREIKG